MVKKAPATPPKIFQIGFNKCGTRTLHRFFDANGFASVHWHAGKLALTMFANLVEGRSLIQGYEKFDVFSDMEHVTPGFAFEAYKLFPQIAAEFPDAVFILNTRDREDWIKSRFNHGDGIYAKRWKSVLGLKDDESLAAAWRDDWDRYHERVHNFFAPGRYRFLQFHIATDTPEAIAALIPERKIDPAKYVQAGKTRPVVAQKKTEIASL